MDGGNRNYDYKDSENNNYILIIIAVISSNNNSNTPNDSPKYKQG